MERLLLPKYCFLANRMADSASDTSAGQQYGSKSRPPLLRQPMTHVSLSKASTMQGQDVIMRQMCQQTLLRQQVAYMHCYNNYLTVALSDDCHQALAPLLGLLCAQVAVFSEA